MEKHEAVWDAFPDHLVGVFRDLGEEGHFADVTIVSDDLIQMQTHKVVLSACSPVLKSLLVTNQHSNPMLYLRGIKHSELQALLKFMYNGETEVLEERINEFLTVANDLGVQITHCFSEEVLAKNERNHQKTSKELGNNFTPPQVMMTIDKSLTEKVSVEHEEHFSETENRIEKNVSLSEVVKLKEAGNNQIKSERWFCDQCESSYAYKSLYALENHKKVKHTNQIFLCDQCNFKSKHLRHLRFHIKSKHLEIRYPCEQCDYRATMKSKLKEHIQVKHEDGGYLCSECSYKAAQKAHLRRHFKSKHTVSAQKLKTDRWFCDQCGLSYTIIYNLEKHKKAIHKNQIFPCDQCDYKSNWADDLQRHIRSKHLGVKYSCDQCDYRATKKFNLKEHIQVKHEGGGYSCSECSYKAAQKSHLRRHFKTKHTISAQKLKTDN